MNALVQSSAEIPEQVYPGLRAFRRDESILFFGRQEHVDELLGRLEDTSFLAVVGLSGSGKSSLVLAGLVPALERGHLGGANSFWQVVEMRPGSDPLAALAVALDRTLGDSPGRAARLRSGRLGLVEAAAAGRKPDASLLLVVDQFEEIFRFQRDFENKAHEAAEFVRLLLAANSDYEARLYVVITMRSDYLGECARFPGLAEALNGSQYLTPRLTSERLREAVTGPAALRGVRIEPGWLESVLDQTSENREQLPVLQHLLRRIWNRQTPSPAGGEAITEQRFRSVGGLQALNEHAESVYGAVGDKELTRRVFQCLTESAEPGHENRRPRKMLELVDETGSDFTAVKDVVDHFRQDGCSFLGPPPYQELTPDSVIDITHESLIRGWERLRGWARENADSGEWYRRIEDRLLTSRGKLYLTGPELEAAVEARRQGGWNRSWAKRYAGKVPGKYEDVIRWLEKSHRRSVWRIRRNHWALIGFAIAMGALALWAIVFSSSWWRDRKTASDALSAANEISEPIGMDLPSRDAMNRLDQVRQKLATLSDHRRDDAPLLMRWSIHIDNDTYARVRRAYFEKFRQLLLAQTQAILLNFLRSLPAKPGAVDYSTTYTALKAYLITTSNPEKSTLGFLAPVLLDRWIASRQVDPERIQLARKQFEYYAVELIHGNPFSSNTDVEAVTKAQKYLSQFGGPDRVYQAMLADAAKNTQPIRFNDSSEAVIDTFAVPGPFTRQGWDFMRQALHHPERYSNGETWVFGGNPVSGTDPAQLQARYYKEFVAHWRNFLRSAVVSRFLDLSDAARKLDVLSSNHSPLLELFSLASQNTAVGVAEVADPFQPVQVVREHNAPYFKALVQVQASVEAAAYAPGSLLSRAADAHLAAQQIEQSFRLDTNGGIDAVVKKLMEDPIVQVEALLHERGR